MRRIVELAESRHITVIPEIDSPGHLGAVLKAHPDLQLKDAVGHADRGRDRHLRPAGRRRSSTICCASTPVSSPASTGTWAATSTWPWPSGTRPRPIPGWRRRPARSTAATPGVQDLADRLAQRPRGGRPRRGQDPAGVERRRARAAASSQPHKDRQIAYWTGREVGRAEPGGVSAGGLEVDQPQRRVPLLRPRPAQQLHISDRSPHLRTMDPGGAPRHRAGSEIVVRARITSPAVGSPCGATGPVRRRRNRSQRGSGLPLTATAQKLWDPEKPALSWEEFKKLAEPRRARGLTERAKATGVATPHRRDPDRPRERAHHARGRPVLLSAFAIPILLRGQLTWTMTHTWP